MVGGGDLRKRLGLRGIFLVAARAEDGGIKLGGCHGSGIIGVSGQGAVASFAVHVRVLALLLLPEDISMASLAGLMTGKLDWPGRHFGDGVAAVVPVLTEAFRDQETAHDEEQGDASDENPGQSKQMSGVLEDVHAESRWRAEAATRLVWPFRAAGTDPSS